MLLLCVTDLCIRSNNSSHSDTRAKSLKLMGNALVPSQGTAPFQIPSAWLETREPSATQPSVSVSFDLGVTHIPALWSLQTSAPGDLASTTLSGDNESRATDLCQLALTPLFRISSCAGMQPQHKMLPGRNLSRVKEVAAISRKGFAPGYKSNNQDSNVAVCSFLHGDHALFGVMDGHGAQGHLVSSFTRQRLPMLLLNKLLQGCSPDQSMEQAFIEADSLITTTTSIDAANSGTTAVVGLLRGNNLTTAWVGDSRAIVGRRLPSGTWAHTALTVDHKPDLPAERARIEKLGGRVERNTDRQGRRVGPHRVWLPHLNYPGLAMSRAIGDTIARDIGVIPHPDVASHQVTPRDKFLVFASDGVWEYLDGQQVTTLVGEELERAGAFKSHQQPRPPQNTSAHKGSSVSLSGQLAAVDSSLTPLQQSSQRGASPTVKACARLVATARECWMEEYGGAYIDDISAVVVLLQDG